MATPDHDALRERYRIERDKRIRPDGNDQYLQPTGRYAHLLDDPYVERVERDPVRVDVDVAIIGGGFAGLCVGARLRERGVQDLRIIEGGGDVGGAWYWNRYPGAMCDTAAMIYLPLLEETGYLPSAKYVPAPEIFAHARRIAETGATSSAPGSSPWGPGRCTGPSSPASPASRHSTATPSTPAVGTTTTPAATRRARR